jgi:hypothetical protein
MIETMGQAEKTIFVSPERITAGRAAVAAIVNSLEARIWSMVSIAASVCTFNFCTFKKEILAKKIKTVVQATNLN